MDCILFNKYFNELNIINENHFEFTLMIASPAINNFLPW